MSLEIIAIMLFAACLHASWNVVIKGGSNKFFESGINVLGGGLAVVCILPFLPLPEPAGWPFLCCSMCIHIAYYLSISIAYRQSEMSYAYTLMRGSAPLFTALGMAVLGQDLSFSGWLGILCLSAGVLTLTGQSFLSGHFNKWGTLAAFGTAIVIMGYTMTDGFGVRASGHAVSYTCWLYLFNTFPVNLIIISRHRKDYFHYLKGRWKIGILGGIFSFASYAIALWAMTRAPIQLVAALRETSVVFGMLMAVLFLGERFTKLRLLAVILVASGTIIMRVA